MAKETFYYHHSAEGGADSSSKVEGVLSDSNFERIVLEFIKDYELILQRYGVTDDLDRALSLSKKNMENKSLQESFFLVLRNEEFAFSENAIAVLEELIISKKN